MPVIKTLEIEKIIANLGTQMSAAKLIRFLGLNTKYGLKKQTIGSATPPRHVNNAASR